MKINYLIDMNPEKRGKKWVVAVHHEDGTLDAEYSFDLKRQAVIFIDGWCECLSTHNR